MNYSYIPLKNGLWARVSNHRHSALLTFVWLAKWEPKNQKWYAYRTLRKSEGVGTIYMHRHIMGCVKGDGREVDHVDSNDTLNNQDDNLRFATRTEQNRNRGPRKDNTSGYRGVTKDVKRPGRWIAQIWYDGTNHVIRRGIDPAKGHKAYKRVIQLRHKEFGRFD